MAASPELFLFAVMSTNPELLLQFAVVVDSLELFQFAVMATSPELFQFAIMATSPELFQFAVMATRSELLQLCCRGYQLRTTPAALSWLPAQNYSSCAVGTTKTNTSVHSLFLLLSTTLYIEVL